MCSQLSLNLEVNKKSQDKFRGAFIGAAIGDALGFITEFMRNSNEIRRQFQLDQLDRFVDWERITTYYKAGNKNYIKLPLSSGAYSDDTQLTLATARSIKADGSFNPETFSKFELPLWLQYELGGGSGTKAAAKNLLNPNISWYNNFYDTSYTSYIKSGGNGAAMRILPIALVNIESSTRLYIDIWRNSIITHGHPRGLMGALLLADSIKLLIENPQSKVEWVDGLIEKCSNYSQLEKIWSQDNLFSSWKNKWQNVCNQDFTFAWNDICKETIEYLELVKREHNTGDLDKILTRIGCFERQTKGAGNITVVASILFLCRFNDFQNGSNNFENVIIPIVNKIGIDTDTIAYFAGAMLGVKYGLQSIPELFKQKIQDYDYLLKVADYCYDLYTKNKNLKSIFSYPESKNLNLPKISALLQNPDVSNKSIDIPIFGNAKILRDDDITLTWQGKHLHFVKLELEFGQTIYCKVERDFSHTSKKVEELHTKSQSIINSLSALDEFKNIVESSNFNSEVILDILRELKFERKDKAIYNAFMTWLWASLPNKNQ